MRYLQENYAEPVMEGSGQFCLSVFPDKETAFIFFMQGFHNGIQGDFAGLVSLNYDDPPTSDYFKSLWREFYPNLLTESDRPQCVECAEFADKIQHAKQAKDNALISSLTSQQAEHIKWAKALFQVCNVKFIMCN